MLTQQYAVSDAQLSKIDEALTVIKRIVLRMISTEHRNRFYNRLTILNRVRSK